MKKLPILITLILILGISSFIFYKEGSLPVDKSDTTPVDFQINPGETSDAIINNLAKEKLIRNRVVFYLIIKQKGIEKNMQAGNYKLTPAMNASQIAESLTHGTLDVAVTIPEGMRKEEIAEILSTNLGVSETEFNQLAKEGYLYPNTYYFPKGATATQVIDVLTREMDKNYAKVEEKARAKGLTKDEVLTFASLIEREALGDEDRQEIANIIYKRLKEDWPLQIDATIQYALGYQPGEKKWWTQRLTQGDYQSVTSPYNTYLHKGLPPGPIGAPRIESLEAVVNADPTTKNWYYYHDKNGKAHFTEDLGDHESNLGK
ncbi:endolytic transglycosylase MltG [soil metagenome]